MASKLHKFRELVDQIEDLEQLKSGAELMQDMVEIIQCQQRMKKLENGLTQGGKAMFYFFAMGLDDDEMTFAAEKIVGKVKRMQEKLKAEKDKQEAEAAEKAEKKAQEKLEAEASETKEVKPEEIQPSTEQMSS